ncbi:hypothetical protein [Microvirga roseola]|uniref:hypothetical protein n=2 Tax=Microvirga roseola TaxID=2883126 RepID=UPI001E4B340E|nr:hypothetical protein [Microvirga roseola]
MKNKKPTQRTYRTRFDPPTLEEAIFAAQGLAEHIEGQTQIAAMLMGLPEDEVRAAVKKAALASPRPPVSRSVAGRRTVVIENRSSRTLSR